MDIGKIKCSFGLHKWDGGKCTRLHCSKTRDQSDDIEELPEHVRQELEGVEREWVEREARLKVELLEQLDLLLSVEGELERWQWPGQGKEPELEQEGPRQSELVQEREHLRQERVCLRRCLKRVA
ncbi:hypothetical protein C2W62_19060 [Candidatus Entotheonella serta]|nr:hypothetical protein C2W62_19060 [Candidatus Entotheonella serta]